MPLSQEQVTWYRKHIETLDPHGEFVKIDTSANILSYSSELKSDKSNQRSALPEEWVHALAMLLLINKPYNYTVDCLYHEQYFQHGRKGTYSDEVDLIIYDGDNLPYAIWEFKSSSEYEKDQEDDIKFQLFGTAPLVGAPKLLVHATVHPDSVKPTLTIICIDYTKHQSYESWVNAGKPSSNSFPIEYREIGYEPYTNGGEIDLKMDCTQADFRAAASIFHNEFFGEHPDNLLFTNLVKCLLAKIYDERKTKIGSTYQFQVLYKRGKQESAQNTFERVNNLYSTAYKRYIDPNATTPDEINPKEFSPERVKTVVNVLQNMSVTKGAALNGDVIGAFFEEILRVGFKQDKGMYFTHDNLVEFMLAAIDLEGLTLQTWGKATHPENRLPYVIDPACGAGTFLLTAMRIISNAVRKDSKNLVADFEAQQFFNARMSETNPNYWAENFLYGLDPKFVMAITAKVNMVLHGDGSAHIFKHDAFKPLATFADPKFRPAGERQRSVPKSQYGYNVCETFDLVVSNPPFGITLASETKAGLKKTFQLKSTLPSESLFLERSFQLLKPNGRLGLVVPESILNTSDAIDVRLFLYRYFWIRGIVSLPRNVFIDTPTLTSLLFAQKKKVEEIQEYHTVWGLHETKANEQIKRLKSYLSKTSKINQPVGSVQEKVLKLINPIASANDWLLKGGKNPTVLGFTLPTTIITTKEAVDYYKDLLKLAGFGDLVQRYVFKQVATELNYEYPVFLADEVGFKLSKRKEKARPNHLCKFVSSNSNDEYPNLHLTDDEFYIEIDTENPERILDHFRKMVKWS